MKAIMDNAHEKGKQAGAREERERIAKRQVETEECPPEYPCHINACITVSAEDCKKCWLDWLEADE